MATATTTVASAPTAPANLTATAISSGPIDLAWQDAQNETGYAVEHSESGLASWLGANGGEALAANKHALQARRAAA